MKKKNGNLARSSGAAESKCWSEEVILSEISVVSTLMLSIFFLVGGLFLSYYVSKIEELQIQISEKMQNLERLKAQRNEMNSRVRLMREELTQLHEPGSHVGEVVKAMGKTKVLVKVIPEGKYVVDLEKDIDINKCTPNTRVALRSDSYTLHKILPTKVDPLVSLMKVRWNSYFEKRKEFERHH